MYINILWKRLSVCVLKDDLFLGIVVFGKMLMELESEQLPSNPDAEDIFIYTYVWLKGQW